VTSLGLRFACVLGIGLLAAPPSHGGVSLLAFLDFNETIRATDWDVVVATIAEVSAHAPTNGNPPRIKLTVHKVLRGAPRPETIDAVWEPPWHDIDWVGGGAESLLARWEQQPMEAPKAGHRMILLGEGTPLRIGPTSRAVWTPAAENDAAAAVRARVQDLKTSGSRCRGCGPRGRRKFVATPSTSQTLKVDRPACYALGLLQALERW
jgi:hypothetical protein